MAGSWIIETVCRDTNEWVGYWGGSPSVDGEHVEVLKSDKMGPIISSQIHELWYGLLSWPVLTEIISAVNSVENCFLFFLVVLLSLSFAWGLVSSYFIDVAVGRYKVMIMIFLKPVHWLLYCFLSSFIVAFKRRKMKKR